jgi:hypothetical protein
MFSFGIFGSFQQIERIKGGAVILVRIIIDLKITESYFSGKLARFA